jgi:hypothetical protein
MGKEGSILSTANRAFDDVFKRPPSRLGDEAAPGKMNLNQARRGGSLTKNQSSAMTRDISTRDFSAVEDSGEETELKAQVEASWFDNFVDRKNISLDD